VTERRAAARAFSRRRLLAVSAAMLPAAATAACGSPDLLAPPPGPSPSVRTLRASIERNVPRTSTSSPLSDHFLKGRRPLVVS